ELVGAHPPLHQRLPHPPDPDFKGIGSGSFSAPDHDYPSSLLIQLTAGSTTAKAPFTITVIQKGAVQLTAPSPQRYRGKN
ncbi:MAG: hypothetical protein ACJ742_08495, partial [Actinomycetes bacterium]